MMKKGLSGIQTSQLIVFHGSQNPGRFSQFDHTIDPSKYNLWIIGLNHKIYGSQLQAF